MRNHLLYPFKKFKFFNRLHKNLPFDYSDKDKISNQAIVFLPKRSITLEINFDLGDNVSLINNQQIEVQTTNAYTLENITVFSENGVLMNEQKTLFLKTARGKNVEHLNWYYNLDFNKPKKCFNECSTYIYAPDNYWHFHFEFLFRLLFFKEQFPEVQIYINPLSKSWQLELLQFYEIEPSSLSIIDIARNKYLFFKEFIFLDYFGTKFIGFNDSYSSKFLQSKLYSSSFLNNENERKRRIYISRSEALTRKIINESELTTYLRKFNFEIITPDKLSVSQQYNLFASAEIVIGQHGGGLTNCIACRNATIIELFNPNWPMNMYCLQTASTKNNYIRINCLTVGLNPQTADYVIEMTAIKKILKIVLK